MVDIVEILSKHFEIEISHNEKAKLVESIKKNIIRTLVLQFAIILPFSALTIFMAISEALKNNIIPKFAGTIVVIFICYFLFYSIFYCYKKLCFFCDSEKGLWKKTLIYANRKKGGIKGIWINNKGELCEETIRVFLGDDYYKIPLEGFVTMIKIENARGVILLKDYSWIKE